MILRVASRMLTAAMPPSDRAARLNREAIIIDPCVQYLLRRTDRTDRAGLTAVGLTIPMPNEDAAQTLPRVQQFLEIIHAEPTFCLADSPAAIRRAKAEGKLAHILLSQDALFVGANPKSLLLWKQLGLRICQLTYNEQNLLGSGCLERHDAGLSQLGRVMVREMERYGVTIDLTHAGRRTFMDICAAATQPLIASHSNPKAIVDNPRNIDDDQIRAVAASGGVVCVTTWAPLIWNGTPGMPTLADWLRCLDHAVGLVGIDHVGVSTDSMGTMGAYPQARARPRRPALRVGDRRLRPPGSSRPTPTTDSRRTSTASRTSRPWSTRSAATVWATRTSGNCSAATCSGSSTPPGSRIGSDDRAGCCRCENRTAEPARQPGG